MAEWFELPVGMSPEYEEQWQKLVEPIIARLNGRATLQEVIEAHTGGRNRIYATLDDGGCVESVAVTRIKQYRSGLRVFSVDFMAGKLDTFLSSFEDLEKLAREGQCHRIQGEGRKGWKRVFGPGWREYSRAIEKEVDYGRRRRHHDSGEPALGASGRPAPKHLR